MEIQSKLYELDWFERIDPTALPVRLDQDQASSLNSP